jgi:predicted permease
MRRRSAEARLAEEVQAHLDALAAEHVARGLAPDEARLAARRDFGGIDLMVETHRDQRRPAWAEALWHDLRLAVRRLAAEPWFSLAVVVALAIGVGASVSVVGAVTAISLSQPPFRDPGAVLAISTLDARGQRADVSWAEVQAWRERARSFEELAAFSGAFFTIGVEGRAPERVQGAYVASGTFRVLGLTPARGRDFVDTDDRPGAPSVAVVGESTAVSLFGTADDAIGRTVPIDGVPTTVIGVMPAEVSFPLHGGLWRPLAHLPGLHVSNRDRRMLGAIGRLAPGHGRAAALAELDTIARNRPDDRGQDSASQIRPTLMTFRERFVGRTTEPVPLALLVVSGMVLAIGCATAATLLFARSAYRMDEITMRVALGASRRRLVTQLLAECAVCAVVAGVLGLVAARFALQWFASELSGAGLPPWVHFTIDARVVAIAIGATLAATGLGGLAPAWRLTSTALTNVPGRTRVTDGRPTHRWIRGLLVAKVALTLVLLATSGYLLSGARALWRADQTLDPSGVVTARLGVSGPTYARPEDRVALTRRLTERLRARGDLTAVTVTTAPPFANAPARRVAIDRPPVDGRYTSTARLVAADPAYYAMFGLRPLSGRVYTEQDDATAPVAVVNAAFAARHFGADAVGRRLQISPSATEAPAGPWVTVVGVVPSRRHSTRPDGDAAVYVPMGLEHPATVYVAARAAAGVPVADVLRDELRSIDPTLALYGWMTLERMSEISRWTMRTIGTIVLVLGSLALALGALGIYAVTAYAAGRRVKEAGIRLAIGASVPAVTRLFLGATLRAVGLGLALGLVAGYAVSRALLGLILDGAAVGTPMLLPAAGLIAAVAIAAAILPARRVAASDPLHALRCD